MGNVQATMRRLIEPNPMLRVMVLCVALAACGGSTDGPQTAVSTAETTQTTQTTQTTEITETSETSEVAGATPVFEVERGPAVGEPQAEPGPGEVKLWISNQSFTDDPIDITVLIDGQVAIDEQFEVKGQHNWISFFVRGLTPGEHSLTARSGTGVEQQETFDVSEDEPRWMVLDYWFYPEDDGPEGGRSFTFDQFDHPVGFA